MKRHTYNSRKQFLLLLRLRLLPSRTQRLQALLLLPRRLCRLPRLQFIEDTAALSRSCGSLAGSLLTEGVRSSLDLLRLQHFGLVGLQFISEANRIRSHYWR